MENPHILRAQAEEKKKAVLALTSKADAITDEELAQAQTLGEEIKGLLAQAEKIEATNRTLADLNGLAAPVTTMPPRGPSAGHDPINPNAAIPGVAVGEPGWRSDPTFGFGKGGLKNMLMAIYTAHQTKRVAKNLAALSIHATAGSDEHGAFNDPYGGFLIPETLLPGVLQVSAEPDFLTARTTKIPLGPGPIHVNCRVDKDHSSSVSGGLSVAWKAEHADGSSSRVETEQITFDAHELIGVSYATDKLMKAAGPALMALLQSGFGDEFISKLTDSWINGNGVGKPQGFMNSASLITVPAEANQDADTILYENIVKMFARLWGNGIWIASKDTIPQLCQLVQQVGTAGYPVFIQSAVPGMPPTIFGMPVYFSEYVDKLGDLGDICLVNMSQYITGKYGEMEQAASIHVEFLAAKECFRFMMSVDGRSWWNSALTPKNGGATQSPFVTLAERA